MVDQITRILPVTLFAGFAVVASQIAPDSTCTKPGQVGGKGPAFNMIKCNLRSTVLQLQCSLQIYLSTCARACYTFLVVCCMQDSLMSAYVTT